MTTEQRRYTNVCLNLQEQDHLYDDALPSEGNYEQALPSIPQTRKEKQHERYITAVGGTQIVTQPNLQKSADSKAKSGTLKNCNLPRRNVFIGVFVIILSSVLLIETTLLLVQAFNPKTDMKVFSTILPPPAWTKPSLMPRSCIDLRQNGYSTSGLYKLYSIGGNEMFEVYCDMETDGGGWTLVASVHEDEIERKCDYKDRWSTYASSASYHRAKTSWENEVTFGNVTECTSDDYKNRAYYSMKAKDIMLWHVPNDTPFASMKEMSKLKYRSTNRFFQDVGGNLKSFFENQYTLNIRENYESFVQIQKRRTASVIEALEVRSDEIISHIPDWYSYQDAASQSIRDRNIYYPEGNFIYFVVSPGKGTDISYDEEYWHGGQSNFSTIAKTSQPFMMSTAIGNDYMERSRFYQRVDSRNRLYPTSNQTKIDGSAVMGDYTLLYRSFQYVANSTETACEFHFIVYNEKNWRSTMPGSFELYDNHYDPNTFRWATYQVDESPRNIVFGYILLARQRTLHISEAMLKNVSMTILSIISEIPSLFNEFGGSDGLVVPVTFDQGNEDAALDIVPVKLTSSVQSGYVQLRAYNQMGFPNALCPGVKMKWHTSEYVCIGGISNDMSNNGTCGDFAGWEGEPSTGEYAHSEEDINTSILIFYR